ncbi:MAG: glycosyltransferase family 2 protein [Candidatus Omnitrophica bacterium]|nr:glycosyltransferase family 2 protein [Candidatus Omnitrophota bacterium]
MGKFISEEIQKFVLKSLFDEEIILNKDSSWPKISIVTPSWNSAQFLERTILSVLNQNYPNLEYIVIDGESTDRSVAIIKKYDKYLEHWISEPDKGIYDAMNKGIRLASGDWVNFMNAGDVFYNSNSVSLLTKYFREDAVLIYGDVRISYDDFERTQYAKSFSRLWRGASCCHQSVFIKKQILAKLKFNLEYNLAADYELLCRVYLGGYQVSKVDVIISKVINGGQADIKRIEVLREFQKIACSNFKTRAMLIYIRYQSLILLERIKKCIKDYCPRQMVRFYMKHKYRLGKR